MFTQENTCSITDILSVTDSVLCQYHESLGKSRIIYVVLEIN